MITVLWILLLIGSKIRASEVGVSAGVFQKLVDKGVISHAEADRLFKEGQREVSSGTQSLLGRTDFEGDFRVRYQIKTKKTNERETDGAFKGRFRLRFQTDAIPELLTVHYGVGTGQSLEYKGRSNNIGFSGGMAYKDIILTHVNMALQLTSQLQIVVGKYYNPYFQVSHLVFDPDMTLEGTNIKWETNDILNIIIQGGPLSIDDSKGLGAFILSTELSLPVTPVEVLSLAFNWYNFMGIKGKVPHSGTEGGNRLVDNSGTEVYANNYSTIHCMVSYSHIFVAHLLFQSYIEYLQNVSTDTNNAGLSLGVSFGANQFQRMGDWRLNVSHNRFEGDVMPSFLANSDVFDGQFGYKGWSLNWEVVAFPGVNLKVGYLNYERHHSSQGTLKRFESLTGDMSFRF